MNTAKRTMEEVISISKVKDKEDWI